MTAENTCAATRDSLVCTLHQGHKGTHYDSFRDVSFKDAPSEGRHGKRRRSSRVPAK
jgi:hypothetical protein